MFSIKRALSIVMMAFTVAAPIAVVAAAPAQPAAGNKAEQKAYKDVDTKTMKAWIDQHKDMVIIDARSGEDDDHKRLPKAINLSYDSSDSKIRAAVPNQSTVVVIYCADAECSAGTRLANRLVRMGYRNVYRYADGMTAWSEAGHPVDPAKG